MELVGIVIIIGYWVDNDIEVKIYLIDVVLWLLVFVVSIGGDVIWISLVSYLIGDDL